MSDLGKIERVLPALALNYNLKINFKTNQIEVNVYDYENDYLGTLYFNNDGSIILD